MIALRFILFGHNISFFGMIGHIYLPTFHRVSLLELCQSVPSAKKETVKDVAKKPSSKPEQDIAKRKQYSQFSLNIDSLVQDLSIYSTLAMEILQSCNKS